MKTSGEASWYAGLVFAETKHAFHTQHTRTDMSSIIMSQGVGVLVYQMLQYIPSGTSDE